MSYRWLLQELSADSQGPYLKSIMPSRLLYAVRSTHPIFRGFQQHDSQEFLRLFMDSLAEDTKVPHFSFDERKSSNKVGSEEGSENGRIFYNYLL
jgi:ubiquitin C-terminal hydrolase